MWTLFACRQFPVSVAAQGLKTFLSGVDSKHVDYADANHQGKLLVGQSSELLTVQTFRVWVVPRVQQY